MLFVPSSHLNAPIHSKKDDRPIGRLRKLLHQGVRQLSRSSLADGKLGRCRATLVGFVFKPARIAGQHPAIVLMHGRAGAYSSEAKGI